MEKEHKQTPADDSSNPMTTNPFVKPIFYLEGNIGAGKSTLAKGLAELNKYKVVAEPVKEWQNVEGFNLLNLLSQDRNTWGLPFQVLALSTLIKRQNSIMNNPEILILERSVTCSHHVFAQDLLDQKVITPEHMAVLRTVIGTITLHKTRPIKYIYVRTPPDVAAYRANLRGRSEEKLLPNSYFHRLHHLLDRWLLEEETNDVHVISGLYSKEDVLKEANEIIQSYDP